MMLVFALILYEIMEMFLGKSTAPHLGMPPIRAPIYTKISDFDVFLIK